MKEMQVFFCLPYIVPQGAVVSESVLPSPALNNRVPFWNAASPSRKVLRLGWGVHCDFSSLCLLVLEL